MSTMCLIINPVSGTQDTTEVIMILAKTKQTLKNVMNIILTGSDKYIS